MTDTAAIQPAWGETVIARPDAKARPKIIRANEMGQWGVCAAIYGPPGVGKTTFVSDAADSSYGAPLLFLDVEGGSRTISHRADIDVAPITNEGDMGFKHLKDYITDLGDFKLDKKYQTVVLDNISETIALCVRHILRTVSRNIPMIDRPDQYDWGKVNIEMLLLVRDLRDFARVSGTNVFFIAWEAPEKDESTGRIKRDIAVNPSFARQFPGIIDMVGHMTVFNDKGIREVSFAPSDKTASKFRRSGDEVANQIPDIIRYRKDQKPIVDILATLKGRQPWPVAKYAKENVMGAKT